MTDPGRTRAPEPGPLPPGRAAGTALLVDGSDGSGKSRFAGRLHEILSAAGTPAALVAIDDFRRPVDWAGPRGEAEIYYQDYFDLDAAGQRATEHLAAGRLVLLEGVFTRRVPGQGAAPLVWLEVSPAEAERRIVARDMARGRSEDDVRHRITARYGPGQLRYQRELCPGATAALVVDNNAPAHPRILRGDFSGLPPAFAQALRALLG